MDVNEYVANDGFVDAYKRAVYKRAPVRFAHEPLEPAKHGGNYSYGLRIHPLPDPRNPHSMKDAQGGVYEIWRRWEDCLYLLDVLEEEYAKLLKGQRSARTKKAAIHSSPSDPSLPPADPWLTSAGDEHYLSDVHVYLPRLTKKGTLFKPSAATVAQRSSEYHALVNALLGDGLPPALRTLRQDRLVHDFFGYWRRDYDLAQKMGLPSPVVVEPFPTGERTEPKRPARLKTDIRIVPPVRAPSPVDSTSFGPPSLTSGTSSDICGCNSLATPTSDRWSATIRRLTYPPAHLQDLISQEQELQEEVPVRGSRTRKVEGDGVTVRVDTVEEVFQDRRNVMELTPSFVPFPIPTPRPLPPQVPALPSPSSLHLDSPMVASIQVVAAQPEPPQSQPSLPSWAPLRPRLRSLSQPPVQDELAKRVPGLQPVPPPGTRDAKIIILPKTDSCGPSPSSKRPGLPAPPPSTRLRREGCAESLQETSRPSFSKTDSSGTFGGFNVNEIPASPRGSDQFMASEERPMSATSVGASVLSGSGSEISFANVQQCVAGRVSSAPPRVVWIKRQPMPMNLVPDITEDPSSANTVPQIQEPANEDRQPANEHIRIPSAGVDIRKSQLDLFLDMDVSQRWWRTGAAADTNTVSEPTKPTSEDRMLAPPLSARSTTTQSGSVSLARESSISSYAHSIERTRRSDPRHIRHWASRVPSGSDLDAVSEQPAHDNLIGASA